MEHLYLCQSAEEQCAVSRILQSCYLNLGVVYQKMGRWGEAVRACDAALEVNPQCAKAYYRKAQVRIIVGVE